MVVNPAFHGMIANQTIQVMIANSQDASLFSSSCVSLDEEEFKRVFKILWDLNLETREMIENFEDRK